MLAKQELTKRKILRLARDGVRGHRRMVATIAVLLCTCYRATCALGPACGCGPVYGARCGPASPAMIAPMRSEVSISGSAISRSIAGAVASMPGHCST